MAKKNKDYSRYHVEEVLSTLSHNEKSHWGKFLVRASMDDSPATVDIRHLGRNDDGSYIIGKGISLNDSEADTLTDALVSNGYGSIMTLAREYKRRKNTFYSDISDEELGNGTH